MPFEGVKSELQDAFFAQCEADQAATMRRHEIDRIGGGHLCGNDQVALILTILVVDKDIHAPIARLVYDFLNPDEDRCLIIVVEEIFQFSERVGRGIPGAFSAIAQSVGVKSRRAGETGAS